MRKSWWKCEYKKNELKKKYVAPDAPPHQVVDIDYKKVNRRTNGQKTEKNSKNEQKWGKMSKNEQKWGKMSKNEQKWGKMTYFH